MSNIFRLSHHRKTGCNKQSMLICLTVQVATVWALKHVGRADRIVETEEALVKLLQGHIR